MKFNCFFRIVLVWFIFFSVSQVQAQLSVHGYLTQAFAISSDYQIHGIPKNGTSDYRNLALQFRYDVNESNNFVFQFSHERLGKSPVMSIKEDFELDWAYFEYKIPDLVSIKVGKIQIPFGIYNEIRDVGTLIAFYRIPYVPYGEGNYMSETVDGLLLTNISELYEGWKFESNLYFGRWEWFEYVFLPNTLNYSSSIANVPINYTSGIANVPRAFGTQFWLRTPLEGLSFGGGLIRGKVTGGLSFTDDYMGEQIFNIIHFSVDASFDLYYIRSELLYNWMDDYPQKITAFSFQTGYYILENMSLNLQTEYSLVQDAKFPELQKSIVGGTSGDFNHYGNIGIGIKYDFFTYLSAKLEHHWFRGLAVEDKYLRFLADDPVETRYAILSVATSF